MFVPFRDEEGKIAIRPALIGFIKNDSIRRSLMIVYWPLTLTLTFFINYAVISIKFILMIIGCTIVHIQMMTKMPWQDNVWNKPRQK